MFLSPYATVIVGAMPVNATVLVGTMLPFNITVGATPTKLTEFVNGLIVFAKTIFKYPPSL